MRRDWLSEGVVDSVPEVASRHRCRGLLARNVRQRPNHGGVQGPAQSRHGSQRSGPWHDYQVKRCGIDPNASAPTQTLTSTETGLSEETATDGRCFDCSPFRRSHRAKSRPSKAAPWPPVRQVRLMAHLGHADAGVRCQLDKRWRQIPIFGATGSLNGRVSLSDP